MTPQEEKKYLKIGGIVAGSLLVLYLLFKKPADNSGAISDPTGNTGDNTGNNNAIPFNANSIAENLFQLMNVYGTKEDEIISELTNVTPTQFAKVITAFGKKPYYLFGSNDWFGTPQGLKYWLQEELGVTSTYYRTLKLKYPAYL